MFYVDTTGFVVTEVSMVHGNQFSEEYSSGNMSPLSGAKYGSRHQPTLQPVNQTTNVL